MCVTNMKITHSVKKISLHVLYPCYCDLPKSHVQSSRPRLFKSWITFLWALVLFLQFIEVRAEFTRVPSDTKVVSGEDVILSCAWSDSSVVIAWLKGNSLLSLGTAVQVEAEEKRYSIVNGSDLKITSASLSLNHSGVYKCQPSRQEFRTATITVLVAPGVGVITPNLNGLLLTEGDEFKLTCASTGGNPSPKIQWKKDGLVVSGALQTDPTTPGGTSSSELTLQLTWRDHRSTFTCEVSNEVNQNQPHTTSVTLNVQHSPRISFQPFNNSYTVILEQYVNITCVTQAYPETISYKWKKDGTDLPQISSSLLFPTVEKTAGGDYECSAFNGIGAPQSRLLSLVVQYGPEISNLPDSITVNSTGSLNLTCVSDAMPPVTSTEWSSSNNNPIAGPTLIISPVSPQDADNYTCEVSNQLSPSGLPNTRRSVTHTVQVFVQYPPGRPSITVSEPHNIGDQVEISCALNDPGFPVGSIEWQKEGSNQITPGPVYRIQNAVLSDSGTYKCRGKNLLGAGVWESANIFINEPPRITSSVQPLQNVSILENNFQLSCEGRGRPQPAVQWLKDGDDIQTGDYYELSDEQVEPVDEYSFKVTRHLLFKGSKRREESSGLDKLLISDTANYTCQLAPDVSQTTQIYILYPPVVEVSPKKIAQSGSATFKCIAKSNPEPLFKWHFNDVELNSVGKYRIQSGGRGEGLLEYVSTLIISDVTVTELGVYRCTATNQLGSNSSTGEFVPKSKPDPCTGLEALEVSGTVVLLDWQPGFNGGEPQNFTVTYDSSEHSNTLKVGQPPVNISGLLPSITYMMTVVGRNSLGESDRSEPVVITTISYNITIPKEVKFDPASKKITFQVPTGDYFVVVRGKVKGSSDWVVLVPRASVETGSIQLQDSSVTQVEISFCLKSQPDICSKSVPAQSVEPTTSPSSDLPTEGVIAIACLCSIIIIILIIVLVCVIRRKSKDKAARDFELETQANRRSQPIAPRMKDPVVKQGIDNPDFKMNPAYPHRVNGGINGDIPSRPPPKIYDEHGYTNTSFESRDLQKFDYADYGDRPLRFVRDGSLSGQESGYSTPEPTKPKKLPKFLQRKRGLVYYADKSAFAHNPPGHTCGLPCCQEGNDFQLPNTTRPQCIGMQISCHESNFSLGRAERKLLAGRPTFKNGNFSMRPISKSKRLDIPDFRTNSPNTKDSHAKQVKSMENLRSIERDVLHLSNFSVGESADDFVDSEGPLPYYTTLPCKSEDVIEWNRPKCTQAKSEEEKNVYAEPVITKQNQNLYENLTNSKTDDEKDDTCQSNNSSDTSGIESDYYSPISIFTQLNTFGCKNFVNTFPVTEDDAVSQSSTEEELDIFCDRFSIMKACDLSDGTSNILSLSDDTQSEVIQDTDSYCEEESTLWTDHNPITLIL